jgi:hypothetical protein
MDAMTPVPATNAGKLPSVFVWPPEKMPTRAKRRFDILTGYRPLTGISLHTHPLSTTARGKSVRNHKKKSE